MPLWCPLTPPINENDVYINEDEIISAYYDSTPIPESELPPIHYTKRGDKRLKLDSTSSTSSPVKKSTTSNAIPVAAIPPIKPTKMDNILMPKPLFDKTNNSVFKLRRDIKMQKLKNWPNFYKYDVIKATLPIDWPDNEFASFEWLPNDDFVLLSTLQIMLELPLNLQSTAPAHQINWDLVSDLVSSGYSKIYRTANECKKRFENIILKREEICLGELQSKKQQQNQKVKGGNKAVTTKPLNICKTKVLRTTQLYTQDNFQTLLKLHNRQFSKIADLANRKSGNYVLMSPIANRNNLNISHHTYLNTHPQMPFENVILNHNQAKHLSPTVSKAIEAVIVACKTPTHANTFSNEPISFRSPKLCAEIKLEKERKAKLLTQQQQQQQNNNTNFPNNNSNTNINTKQTTIQQQQQQHQKSAQNTPAQTIQKNITITPTQSSIVAATASPSSPTVSNLLGSNQILMKTNSGAHGTSTIRPNLSSTINAGSNSPSVVKSPQQTNTYYQTQQQQQQQSQQQITANVVNSPSGTVSISRTNSTVYSGQPPLRFFATSKSLGTQPITELRKQGASPAAIIQQQTQPTLLKQASPSQQIIQQHKKDKQATSSQISTVTTNTQQKPEIKTTTPATMIISSSSTIPSASNTQIQIQSPSTTVITTTTPTLTNKSQTVLVKQATQIRPTTPTSTSTASFETLLKCQQISRQQSPQIQPQLTQLQTNTITTTTTTPSAATIIVTSSNNIGAVTTSTVTTVVTTQAANITSPATFAALIKPLNNVALQLQPQQKLPQTNIITASQQHQFRQFQFSSSNPTTIVSTSSVTLAGSNQNQTNQQPIRKVQFFNRPPIQLVQTSQSNQKGTSIFQQVFQQQATKIPQQTLTTSTQNHSNAPAVTSLVNAGVTINPNAAAIVSKTSTISAIPSPNISQNLANKPIFSASPPILSLSSTSQGQQTQNVQIPASSISQVIRQISSSKTNNNDQISFITTSNTATPSLIIQTPITTTTSNSILTQLPSIVNVISTVNSMDMAHSNQEDKNEQK